MANSGVPGPPPVFVEPCAQDRDGAGGERGDPVFATFAVTGDVRARTEVQVGAGEPDQLGDPQPGLDGQVQHCVIAPTGPAGGVAGREQRLDLGFGEVGDHGPVAAFRWDRQHSGDALRVFGVL